MKDRKCLIFCVNIAHSQELNNLFKKNGISSCHIDGTLKYDEKISILSSFRNGDTKVLFNSKLLTEGFDEPSIDGLIFARPTRSKIFFLQMLGRGLRISPNKKNCRVIDIVDNHKSLQSFNCILTDNHEVDRIERFNKINDIKDHIKKQKIILDEIKLERVDLLGQSHAACNSALPCMISYLKDNQIYFQEPISFDEASFLIWYNELRKKYYGSY